MSDVERFEVLSFLSFFFFPLQLNELRLRRLVINIYDYFKCKCDFNFVTHYARSMHMFANFCNSE